MLGWNSRPWEGDAGYSMLAAANGPVGGARVVGKDPLATTAGPNWLSYVGVPDLAIALATAQGNGGRMLHPITSIPDGGRYAVIADPQGGVIGLYEPAGDMGGSSGAAAAGPIAWHELTAEDPEAALEFYKTLFGWEIVSRMPMGPEVGTYYLFGHGTTQLGGAYTRPKHLPPTWPRWLVYLNVPSVTAAVAAIEAAGGQLLNGPQEVPGILGGPGGGLAWHTARSERAQGCGAGAAAQGESGCQTQGDCQARSGCETRTSGQTEGGRHTPPESKSQGESEPEDKSKIEGGQSQGQSQNQAQGESDSEEEGGAETQAQVCGDGAGAKEDGKDENEERRAREVAQGIAATQEIE